jgi:hypothetical protein
MESKIQTIEESNYLTFKHKVNDLLNRGYLLSSSNCGALDNQKSDPQSMWRAILISPETVGHMPPWNENRTP